MPRKLPWLAKAEPAAGQPPSTASRSLQAEEPPASHNDDVPPDNVPDQRPNKRARPTPSTTTASNPLRLAPPPTEALMIPGADADDAWRMVEDELLATARLFTAHLHAAEYARLRGLARAGRGADDDAAAAGCAPVEDVVVAAALRARGGAAGGEAGDSAEDAADAEDPFMRDATLAAIMGAETAERPAREGLITRTPVTTVSARKHARDAKAAGWVGASVAPVTDKVDAGCDADEMDLDDVPAIPVSDVRQRGKTVAHSASGGAIRSSPSDMWIGPGRSAPASTTSQAGASAQHHRPSSVLDRSNTRTTPSDMYLGSSKVHEARKQYGPEALSTAEGEQLGTITDGSPSNDPGDLKRAALNPRVLARLAKRREQQEAMGNGARADAKESKKDDVIPTFAY